MENYVYYGQEKMYFDLPAKWNLITQAEPTEYEGLPDVKKERPEADVTIFPAGSITVSVMK